MLLRRLEREPKRLIDCALTEATAKADFVASGGNADEFARAKLDCHRRYSDASGGTGADPRIHRIRALSFFREERLPWMPEAVGTTFCHGMKRITRNSKHFLDF